MKYLAGFFEIILKIAQCFAFRLQVYETWLGRVIAPLETLILFIIVIATFQRRDFFRILFC